MPIKISRGLDIPIKGKPNQSIAGSLSSKKVALLGDDYVGMKPTLKVKEGDSVTEGDVLFEDKKTPGVVFTSPASGMVSSINRGHQRKFLSIVIEVSGTGAKTFPQAGLSEIQGMDADSIRNRLIESGLWTSFRTRPYSKVPAIDSKPAAIFVNTMDTHPLSASPNVVIEKFLGAFEAGMEVLATFASQLNAEAYFVKDGSRNLVAKVPSPFVTKEFSGPHPSGLVGTHIHFIKPAHRGNTVWHIDYQDIIAIGKLFSEGKLWNKKIVAVGGPCVAEPKLYEVPRGGDLMEMCSPLLAQSYCLPKLDAASNSEGSVRDSGGGDGRKAVRIISGSIVGGRRCDAHIHFLGRYHNQISIIEEDRERKFLGWQGPGLNHYSVKNLFASNMILGRTYNITSNTNGSHRAIVPVGSYEKVMPLDFEITALCKSLLSHDLEYAEEMGAMELDEEDLGLVNFVCPGKNDFSTALRQKLTAIEKEG